MRTKNPCTLCAEPGLPGLINGAGKCQAHWNALVYGTKPDPVNPLQGFIDHCLTSHGIRTLRQKLAGPADTDEAASWNLTPDEWHIGVQRALVLHIAEAIATSETGY